MGNRAQNGTGISKMKRRDVKVKTANYTLQDHIDENAIFSNLDAPLAVELQLPAAVPGRSCTLLVETACPFRAQPASGEKISSGAGVLGAADKYVGNNVVGCRVTLVCEKAGEWKAMDVVGTWTVES